MSKEEIQEIIFEKNCILRCLESCRTPAQVDSIQKMIATFDKKWDRYSNKLEIVNEELQSAVRVHYKEIIIAS
jgi:hypothetical protein